jgi:serine O-acetyltransferase
MRPLSPEGVLGKYLLSLIKGYNHDKYWKRRAILTNSKDRTPIFIKLYFLYYIKRVDARFGCSFGTNINGGAFFSSPPLLPHGPVGIFVGHDVSVGKDVVIHQQVTIAHGGSKIGDRVMLGAGSKVLKGCSIGSRAKVGANCVVVEDIPEFATVVLPKPRIICREN